MPSQPDEGTMLSISHLQVVGCLDAPHLSDAIYQPSRERHRLLFCGNLFVVESEHAWLERAEQRHDAVDPLECDLVDAVRRRPRRSEVLFHEVYLGERQPERRQQGAQKPPGFDDIVR